MGQLFLIVLITLAIALPLVLWLKNRKYWHEPIIPRGLVPALFGAGLPSSPARNLALSGILCAFAVIFQGSALYVPVAGHFLSHFATLMVTLAATIQIRGGLYVVAAASILLLFVAPKQIPLFLFFDAPLGFWIGWSIIQQKSRLMAWLLSLTSLLLGIICLSYLLGLPALGGLEEGLAGPWIAASTASFAAIYSWAWFSFMEQFLYLFNRLLQQKTGEGKGPVS